MTQSLTVAEKILYHLFQSIKSEDKYEVPFDVTQDGIAQACGISRAHAAIELKKLRESNQILEKLSHVKRAKSRRKVYFLTQEGKTKAGKIVEHVRSENVETGVDSSRISQGTGPAKRARRHSSAIPQPKLFFGRENELKMLHNLAEDDFTELVLLSGLGGIGKTALLSKFARDLKSSVFWFSMSEWETELSLLKSVGNFLDDCGDNRLANYLKSDRVDLGEVSYLLGESLAENRRVLIFDDIDKAPRLNSILKMIVLSCGPNRVFMAMETRPALVDEMRSSGKSVKEITIGGLDVDASLRLLRERGIDGERADHLCQLTDCHPLMLGLVPADDDSSAKLEMSNFVKGTLLKALPPYDMAVVEKCAVMRKPFSPTYLPKDERHVLQLPIFSHLSGSYSMHEMVRNIIAEQIAPSDRVEYNSQAADFYLGENDVPERLYHLIHSGRFLESEMLISSHSDELLSLESPGRILEELKLIPPRVSKYTSSVGLLFARASALLGDESGAIDSLIRIAESEQGEKRAEILLELVNRPLDCKIRSKILSELGSSMTEQGLSMAIRSRIALALASIEFKKGDLGECERLASKGVMIAANSFSLETISSLNRLLGQAYVLEEKYKEAISFLGQTAPSFKGPYRPLFHRLLAKSMFETGMVNEARTNLDSGIKIAEESGLFKELGESLLELCKTRLSSGDVEGAAESAYRSIEVSSSIGEKNIVGEAYAALSKIESERGNLKESEESMMIAERISKEAALSIPADRSPK
jgi:tetratricopeptide (TPR) repeat protein